MPTGEMLANPGLVTVDIVLMHKKRALATFDFEFYVNRAVVSGNEPQQHSSYRLASLDSIQAELDALRAAVIALGGEDYLQ